MYTMRVDQYLRKVVIGQHLLYARWESFKRTHLRSRSSGAAAPRAWGSTGRFAAMVSAAVLAWAASSTNVSAFTLYWTANSSGADGIQIERSTPDANNFVQIAVVGASVTNFTDGAATCGTPYYYRVRAYNSAGESGYSNIAGPTIGACCTYTLSSTGASYASSGASDAVNVTASSSNCAWTAISNVGWISISENSSAGVGNGTVSYTVAANTSSSALTGTVTIAGQTFTIIEPGAPCTYSLSSTGASYSSGSGSDSVNVTAPNGCAWTANNTNSWVTITGGTSSGAGNGTVSYSYSANVSGATRSGVIVIGGQSYNVIQTSVACAYTLSSASVSYSSGGGSGSVNVTAGSSCGWTATSNVGWITITSGTSGTGDGTVSYSVAANTSSSTLTGTVTIAGQTFTVIEAGITPCTYSLSSTSASYASSGGSGSVNVSVTTASQCTWTATSNVGWITIASGSNGSGNGTVTYVAAPAPPAPSSLSSSSSDLTGTITIAGQTVDVIESAT